jgi:hypothetical protein
MSIINELPRYETHVDRCKRQWINPPMKLNCCAVPLSNVPGGYVLADLKYWNEIKRFTWSANWNRCGTLHQICARIPAHGTVGLHRFIAVLAGMNIDGQDIDHIRDDVRNNRVQNLRPALRYQNNQNKGSYANSAIGLDGITWSKRDCRWVVRRQKNGVRTYVGVFKLNELPAAILARDYAERRWNGHEFPRFLVPLDDERPQLDVPITDVMRRAMAYARACIADKAT